MATLETYEDLLAANERAPGNVNRIKRLTDMHSSLTSQGHDLQLPAFQEKKATTATMSALAAEKAKLEADIDKLRNVKTAAESEGEDPPVEGSLLDAIGGKLPEKAPENMFAMQDIEQHNKQRTAETTLTPDPALFFPFLNRGYCNGVKSAL